MKYKVNYYGEHEVELVKHNYTNNGTTAIQLLEDGMPYAMLTVNLEASDGLPENFAFIDVNNCPFAQAFLENNNLGEWTGKIAFSGYCIYPLYKLFV